VRVRTGELFAHMEGVLDTDDIERVHDMRVASRRLRAVLEIFAPCFPKAEYQSVLKDVKRIADALGERRDPDVHIAAMEEFAAAQPAANRPGIARLTEDLRARQAAGNDVLAAELERMRERGLHDRLLALSDAAEGALPGEEAAADAIEAAETGGDPDEPARGDGAPRVAQADVSVVAEPNGGGQEQA
jgi:CHAD domain-containing protein